MLFAIRTGVRKKIREKMKEKKNSIPKTNKFIVWNKSTHSRMDGCEEKHVYMHNDSIYHRIWLDLHSFHIDPEDFSFGHFFLVENLCQVKFFFRHEGRRKNFFFVALWIEYLTCFKFPEEIFFNEIPLKSCSFLLLACLMLLPLPPPP